MNNNNNNCSDDGRKTIIDSDKIKSILIVDKLVINIVNTSLNDNTHMPANDDNKSYDLFSFCDLN